MWKSSAADRQRNVIKQTTQQLCLHCSDVQLPPTSSLHPAQKNDNSLSVLLGWICYVRRDGGNAIRPVCQSVILSFGFCNNSACILQKQSAAFIETWYHDRANKSKELLNFWRWSSSRHRFHIIFHLPHHNKIGDFRRFISICHTVTGQFHDSAKWLMPTR